MIGGLPAFVRTVDKPQMPAWLPKTRNYVGLQRWGYKEPLRAIRSTGPESHRHPRGNVAGCERFADQGLRPRNNYSNRLVLATERCSGLRRFLDALERLAKQFAKPHRNTAKRSQDFPDTHRAITVQYYLPFPSVLLQLPRRSLFARGDIQGFSELAGLFHIKRSHKTQIVALLIPAGTTGLPRMG